MTSKPVSEMLVDLGVIRSHSRPRTSNDNPYSEAQFKTMKYCPEFPDRFGSLAHARAFCDEFFTALQPRTPPLRHRPAHPRLSALRHRRASPRRSDRPPSTSRLGRPTPTGSPAAPDHPAPDTVWINKPAAQPTDLQNT